MSFGAIDGVLSGLSTTDIVTKLMSVERARVQKYEQRKTLNASRSTALRDIATRLNSVQTAVNKLALRGTFAARVATTDTPFGTTPQVAVTANADANTGSFTIRVENLATASRARGTAPAGAAVAAGALLKDSFSAVAVTNGTFTINGAQFTVDTATQSLNDVLAAINAQSGTTGVTASLVADADGRAANRLQLASGGTINVGSAGDTSNFLAATRVLGVPQAGGTITGQGAIGGARDSAPLASANLATAVSGTGSFTINNVAFTYDAAVDSVRDVIGRINSSTAGVTATWDASGDRLVVSNTTTGNLAINFADVSGTFLSAFKLTGAGDPTTLGQAAKYSLDGGATWRYSTSNTVTDAVPGVALTLQTTSTTDTTVTVMANPETAVGAVKGFVDAINNALDIIDQKTAVKNLAGAREPLAGDMTIRGIANSLRSLVGGKAIGVSGAYTSLVDLGVSTGPVGSAVGSTNRLVLDDAKLRAAMAANPNAVHEVFSAQGQAALTMAGDVSTISGVPNRKVSGVYALTSDGAGLLSGTFTPTSGAPEALTGVGSLSAGGTNTTLIPGLTLTGAGSLTGAGATITVNARAGVAAMIGDLVKSLTGSGGTISSRQETISAQQREIDERVRLAEQRLADKEKAYYRQFQALEVALAEMQAQSASLASSLSSLSVA
jgi:flagellar hook-associated protein 2